MIKTLIVDDEQHCIDRLKHLLDIDHNDLINVTGCYNTASEAADAINLECPDLLFLDVQLDGKTGFDLLQELNRVDFEIIFTTAYDSFAVKAFKFNALDYLLKPVDRSDLKLALDKLKRKARLDHNVHKLDNLLDHINSPGLPKRIVITTVNGMEVYEIATIIRCESDINYTTLYFSNRQKIVTAKTLKEFDELLTDHDFFRVHNSHLINLACVKSYNKGKGGYLTLQDGTEIEVSARRKSDFLKKLSHF